jgi:hypothetical protein
VESSLTQRIGCPGRSGRAWVAPLAEAPPRVDGPSGEVLVELGDPTFVTWYAVVERLG